MDEEQIMPTEAENQSEATGQSHETGQVDDENIAIDEEAVADNEPQNENTPDDAQAERAKLEAAFNKKIGKLTRFRKEEERRAEAAEQRAKELEEKLNGLRGDQDTQLPPMPDQFDDDFPQKMAQYNQAVQKRAEKLALQKYQHEQQVKAQQQKQQQMQQELRENTKKMYDGAVQYGIDPDQLKEAESTLSLFLPKGQTGIDMAQYLLAHEQSPLIVNYLGTNLSEAEKIGRMNPYQAVAYIENTVRPNAAKLKPKLTKTPEPVRPPKAKSAGKQEGRFMEGVVME